MQLYGTVHTIKLISIDNNKIQTFAFKSKVFFCVENVYCIAANIVMVWDSNIEIFNLLLKVISYCIIHIHIQDEKHFGSEK